MITARSPIRRIVYSSLEEVARGSQQKNGSVSQAQHNRLGNGMVADAVETQAITRLGAGKTKR